MHDNYAHLPELNQWMAKLGPVTGGAETYAELSVPAAAQSAYSHIHYLLGSLLHWTKTEKYQYRVVELVDSTENLCVDLSRSRSCSYAT